MTFIEFLNREFDKPFSNMISMPKDRGFQVSQDFLSQKSPSFFKSPVVPKLFGGKRVSEKPMVKKPTDFLARKGSSFRKSI